tara:strand:+ start:1261 stop:2397 length:1137 start_codon:yes stop_codon:yes gene_type:complete
MKLNKKLNVLFVCGWYPSKVFPTNGDFIQRHAQAVSINHKVSVLHIVSRKENEEEISIEHEIKDNINSYIAYIKPSKIIFLKIYRFIQAYSRIISIIGHIEIVHLNILYPFGLIAIYLKLMKNIPFIISEHWSGYQDIHSNKISFFEKTISKIITNNASFICPVSINLKLSMENFGLKGSYMPVPNVVDTNLFQPGIKKNKRFTLVHISSLKDDPKNISGMLRVAKKLEDTIGYFNWKFIGGKSDYFESLIKKLDFQKAKIEFIGHLAQKNLVTHLQSANVFVLFSNYENLPCVVLESFSCGIPVIATDVGGISEYFPEKFGYLIPKQNQVKLLEKILEEHAHPNKSKREMSDYARNKFSKKTISKIFSSLYFKAINA